MYKNIKMSGYTFANTIRISSLIIQYMHTHINIYIHIWHIYKKELEQIT